MFAIQMKKLLKEIQFHSPFRHNFFPKYAYNFTVPQLLFLCESLTKTQHVPGSVIEIGCHNGATTVLFNRLMDDLGMRKDYFAVDTFSGFTREDVEFEVKHRGKKDELFAGAFEVNNKKWFDGTMAQNNINRVTSIQADVNTIDMAAHAPYSFALLDVDLYKPTKKCLHEIHDAMSSGGIIIIDDCDEADVRWDGADQAYKEFAAEIDQPVEIVQQKLGVLRKA
ncbi:MAG: class I SAM-dependent methyltransferase [Pseudomonadota bacterium]|nr:class I SAM-dependent methyltransferase [Pseudomonadota bacterium]